MPASRYGRARLIFPCAIAYPLDDLGVATTASGCDLKAAPTLRRDRLGDHRCWVFLAAQQVFRRQSQGREGHIIRRHDRAKPKVSVV